MTPQERGLAKTARFGVFELELKAGELRRDGRRIRLQEQPFQVLVALVERPGDVVTRDELRERIWPTGVVVDFDHSLNKAVNKLREALGDEADNPRFIETLPKRGYRFIAPVQRPSDTEAIAAAAPSGQPGEAGPVVEPPTEIPPPVSAAVGSLSTLPVAGTRRSAPMIAAVLAVCAVAAAVAVWLGRVDQRRPAAAMAPPDRVMLAVLPFRNLAGSPDQEYFSDGLTEEMIAQLGRLTPERLGVIARTSAMHYKQTSKLVAEIGRELGVDYILDGSVRRAGHRVRISAQLVQIKDQTNLWSETYDRDLADIFDIQSDVARRIVSSLALELLPRQAAVLAAPPTTNIAAHEEYLKGRFEWSKRTEEGLRRSLDHFQRASDADPAYALGYVGAADSYNLLANYGALAPNDALPRARAAALKALDLAPSLAEAHASLAWTTLVYDRDVASATAGFERAIALNPGYASAHQWHAFALKAGGRHDEALRAVRRAQELDPLSLIINAVVAWHHYYARQYDEAIAQSRRVIAMDSRFARVQSYLGWALVEKKAFGEGIEAMQKARELFGDSAASRLELAYALAVAGRRDEARRTLDTVIGATDDRYVEPDLVARVYVGLGDRDRAFEWFDRALVEHAPTLVLLDIDPRLDPLRSDPRFDSLVRRAGLTTRGTPPTD